MSEIHIPFQVSFFVDASWKLLSNPMVGCAPVVVLATQPHPLQASTALSLESQEGARGGWRAQHAAGVGAANQGLTHVLLCLSRGQSGLVTSVPGGLMSLFVPASAPPCTRAVVLGPNLL